MQHGVFSRHFKKVTHKKAAVYFSNREHELLSVLLSGLLKLYQISCASSRVSLVFNEAPPGENRHECMSSSSRAEMKALKQIQLLLHINGEL